jgi:hypothetical protein
MPELSEPMPLIDSSDSRADRKASELPAFLVSQWTAIASGIVGPIVCFGVKWESFGDSLNWLPGLGFICYKPVFGYGIIGLEIATLALWLWCGDRLGRLTGGVTGILYFGAVFAGALGLVMLPFSLMGALVAQGIGLLGLVPLLTAVAFFGQGWRAAATAKRVLGDKRSAAHAFLGAVLVFGVPSVLQPASVHFANRALDPVVEKVAQGDLAATTVFERWVLSRDPDRLVWIYRAEASVDRKQRLASAYNKLTGRDIEARIRQLDD